MKWKDKGVKNIRQQRQLQLLSGSERAAFAASETGGGSSCNIPENCCWRLQGRKDGCFTVLRHCIHTESLQRGEAVLRVRSHGKQCRAGEISKVDSCRENISLMGQLASCLWAAGRFFFWIVPSEVRFLYSPLVERSRMKKGLKKYKRPAWNLFERPSAWEQNVSLPYLLMTFAFINFLIRHQFFACWFKKWIIFKDWIAKWVTSLCYLFDPPST